MLLQAVCTAVDLLGRLPACRHVRADESSGAASRSGRNRGQKSGETPATAGLKGGRLVRPAVERNWNDRDAPSCPHDPVSTGYAATSSASLARSKRAPLKLPQRRTRPLFTI